MEQTPNLQLPYIMPSQAQKHVTHNEAIRALDALVQLAVLDRDLSAPPSSPAEGDRYVVAPGGSSAWAGKDGKVAAWQDGAWAFLTPRIGWLIWVADEMNLLSYTGAAWVEAAIHSVNPTPLVGVNATADATNRLSVKSAASLFDQDGGNHRLKINKSATGNTASLLFQSGYSGRAEFGLTGDDDWHLKVSSDGGTWVEALKVDSATGLVRLPAALALSDDNQVVAKRHVRELLTANRTYYVRTDGSNSNSGLVNSAGGAFLTWQKAWDTIVTLDLGGFAATIQIGDGTYTMPLNMAVPPVGGNVVINGNSGTPANVLLSTTSTAAITLQTRAQVTLQNFKITTTTFGQAVIATGAGSKIIIGVGMDFGACASHQIYSVSGAYVVAASNYTVSGGASYHAYASFTGVIAIDSNTVTLTGTPAFSAAFAKAENCGVISRFGVTFSGSATGVRYSVALNGVINTFGGGASAFPGNSAGTTATGGQFA